MRWWRWVFGWLCLAFVFAFALPARAGDDFAAIHVCVRPDIVPPTTAAWVFTGGSASFVVLRDEEVHRQARWADAGAPHHREAVRGEVLGNADRIPAVLLTDAEHKIMTAKLRKATAEVLNAQELWEAYKKVYAPHPDWLAAIKSYFVKGK